MVKAIQITAAGGPEVLRWTDVALGKPGKGEVLLKNEAVGLNFIDIYHRKGTYAIPSYPSGIGLEGAGVIEAVGPGVREFKVGDRVAYCQGPLGAYSEARVMPADKLVKLPKSIDFKTAAAIMLKGMTSQYLLRRTYRVKKGDTIVVHAAAGGVGLMMCQWAKALGATVIGTVGNAEKATLAKAHGCKYPLVLGEGSFAKRVREITKGEGVAVVYDSIGKDTFMDSLDCLRPLGVMALFGASSGPVPPMDLGLLAAKGSLYVTRPGLMTYVAKRSDLLATARDLFKVVSDKTVKVRINQTYALKDAAQAQADLESRKTTGATVLMP
jgi:NADPH2:quinone reductase